MKFRTNVYLYEALCLKMIWNLDKASLNELHFFN